mgnify:CR=1 FL=1
MLIVVEVQIGGLNLLVEVRLYPEEEDLLGCIREKQERGEDAEEAACCRLELIFAFEGELDWLCEAIVATNAIHYKKKQYSLTVIFQLFETYYYNKI